MSPSAVRRRGLAAAGTVALAFGVAACGPDPAPDRAGVSGVPTTIGVDRAAAAEVTGVTSGVDLTQDACALVDMGPARVGELVGVRIEWTEPVGRSELRNHCTYGGPSTVAPRRTTGVDGDPAVDAGNTPSVVSLAVSVPAGRVDDAVALQPAQLAALYRCSGLRGDTGGRPAGVDRPGAPVARKERLGGLHVDCAASPTGGGTEVHVVTSAGGRMWHLVASEPSVPRTPADESAMLDGLYRLAAELPD